MECTWCSCVWSGSNLCIWFNIWTESRRLKAVKAALKSHIQTPQSYIWMRATLTSFISSHSVQPLSLLMCHCFYCRWNEDREAAALSARCYSAVCLLHWHASLHMCFYFLLNHEEHKHTFSLDWKLNYSVNNGIQTDGPKKSSLICLYFSLSGVF